MSNTGEGTERQKEPKRKGRPTNAEHLGRQRTNSHGSVIESFKRKREEEENRIRAEKELLEKFEKSIAVGRSPPAKRTQEEESIGNEKGSDTDKLKSDDTKQEGEGTSASAQDNRDGEMEGMWEGKSERDILIALTTQMRDMKDMIMQENKEIRSEVQQLKEELRAERERNVLRERELEKKMEEKLKDFEKKLLGSEQANKTKTIEARLSKIEEDNQKNIQGISENTDKLRKQVREMEIMMEKRDREERKNNIIIKGLNVGRERKGLEKKIEDFAKERFGAEVKVERASLVGEGKIIWAKIKDQENKRQIMEGKSRLKGEEIYIENDRTVKEREVQRKIVRMAKEQRMQGKEVIVRYWKLSIENKWYSWNEAKAELELQTFFQSKAGRGGAEDGTRME